MQAALNGIALPLPGGAQPARLGAHFENTGAIAVHLTIAPG